MLISKTFNPFNGRPTVLVELNENSIIDMEKALFAIRNVERAQECVPYVTISGIESVPGEIDGVDTNIETFLEAVVNQDPCNVAFILEGGDGHISNEAEQAMTRGAYGRIEYQVHVTNRTMPRVLFDYLKHDEVAISFYGEDARVLVSVRNALINHSRNSEWLTEQDMAQTIPLFPYFVMLDSYKDTSTPEDMEFMFENGLGTWVAHNYPKVSMSTTIA